MPTFKVTMSRRITANRSGNPFLAHLDGRHVSHAVREWTFDAEDETAVKQFLRDARKADIENVRGFDLDRIEQVKP